MRCFFHFQDNCKAKLKEMVSNDSVLEIIQDILGSFLRGKAGLVDACCIPCKASGSILLQSSLAGFWNTKYE